MRKIHILGVAGLLAVTVAIGGGASAQTLKVITFTTDTVPGEYIVTWETLGGCDPTMPDANTSVAASGAAGSYLMTVAVPPGTPPNTFAHGATVAGEAAEFAVVTASHCNYVFAASFVSGLPGDVGGPGDVVRRRCAITGTTATGVIPTAELADGAFTLDTVTELNPGAGVIPNCSVVREIRVAVGPVASGGTPPTYSADGRYRPDIVRPAVADPTVGAVLNTTFTVTVTPVAVPPQSPECLAVTRETEVVENDPDTLNDDRVEAIIRVVNSPLVGDSDCDYDVVVDLPAGFTASFRGSDRDTVTDYLPRPSVKYDDDPTTPDHGEFTTVRDCGRRVRTAQQSSGEVPTEVVTGGPCVDLSVAVAERSVYITQSVVGDSGGATARYSLTEDASCDAPGVLPATMPATGGISGIVTVEGMTVVELREGYFNVSAAVTGATGEDEDGRFRARRFALNSEAEPCVVEASVFDLPDNCSAAVAEQSVDLTTGVDAWGRAVIRFDIACSDDMGGATT